MVKITAFKNRNLTILSIAFGLLFFGFNAAEQHFTAFYQTIGKTNIAFQSLAILYAAIVVGNFVGPTTARKLGIKLSFILGSLAYVALVFGTTLKIQLFIYILSFILGVGAGVAGIAKIDFIRMIAPKNKRGEFAGAIESVRTFGGFIGIAAVSLALKFLNIDGVFLLLGTVMLIGTALLLFLSEPTRETSKVSVKESQNLKLMLKFVKDARILLLVPKSIAGGFLLGLVLGAIPAIIEKDFGIGWVGIITSLFHLTLASVLLLAGYLSDIKGRFGLIYASLLANVSAAVIFLSLQTLPILALVMILLGLGGSLGLGASTALMLDVFEDKVKEATATLSNLGLILGVVPSFILPTLISKNQLFYLAITFTLIGIITLRVFEKRFATR